MRDQRVDLRGPRWTVLGSVGYAAHLAYRTLAGLVAADPESVDVDHKLLVVAAATRQAMQIMSEAVSKYSSGVSA